MDFPLIGRAESQIDSSCIVVVVWDASVADVSAYVLQQYPAAVKVIRWNRVPIT